MKKAMLLFCLLACTLFCGCRAVYDAESGNPRASVIEGNVVFTRPTEFFPLAGSFSVGEYLEITYQNSHRNEAGQLVVEVGIRNCGPVKWHNWWRRAPEQIAIKSRCDFFRDAKVTSPMVYSTNNQNIIIKRGETYAYKAVCPRPEAKSWQLLLGGYNE